MVKWNCAIDCCKLEREHDKMVIDIGFINCGGYKYKYIYVCVELKDDKKDTSYVHKCCVYC